jgi:NAD(P)H-flavin reductase
MDTKIYKIVSNKQLTPSIYEMKLEGDTSMISAPGQFLNIKLDGKVAVKISTGELGGHNYLKPDLINSSTVS